MAPAELAANNWLSFSVSSMEMLANSSQSHPEACSSHILPPTMTASLPPSHNFFFDPFYSNEWVNTKGQVMYSDYAASATITTVPKLEDFFGGENNNTASYNSTTSTTQESSSHSQLTQLYEPSQQQQQDLKQVAETVGFQAAFSTNSGSEVDDTPVTHSAGNLSLGADSDTLKKVADTFGQRTSIYRGVTRHRWTGRYEAHLWDNSCRREGQARKGRQVYLGGYDKEEKAARAYDLAALKYWGPTATTNFPISTYTKELKEMKHMTKQEFIASLRRKSSGFSRGASIYRGVTRHHQQGRWQARIGRVAGNKDLYLGTFATEEEAAEAYDIAAIKFRGVNAVTNFEMKRYDVEAIMKSNLPIGGAAKRLKMATESADQKPELCSSSTGSSNTINFGAVQGQGVLPPFQSALPLPYETAAAIFHDNLLGSIAPQVVGPTELFGSATATPVTLMPQTLAPPQFYIWPYQSY